MIRKGLAKTSHLKPRSAKRPHGQRQIAPPARGKAAVPAIASAPEESPVLTPGQLRSEATRAGARAKAEWRKQIAAEFRASLIAELKIDEPRGSQAALLVAATSAYVEVTELNERYLGGRITAKARTALALARGQLQRALRSLGVIDRGDDEPPAVPSADELLAPYRTAKEADVEPDAVPADR